MKAYFQFKNGKLAELRGVHGLAILLGTKYVVWDRSLGAAVCYE